MYTGITKDNIQINLGDRIYIVTEQGKYQIKISYENRNYI